MATVIYTSSGYFEPCYLNINCLWFDIVIILSHKLFCRQHCFVLCQADVGNGKQVSCKGYQRYVFETFFFLLYLQLLSVLCAQVTSFDHLSTCCVKWLNDCLTVKLR